MVVHALNHSTQEAEAADLYKSEASLVYKEFQDSPSNIVRPCLKLIDEWMYVCMDVWMDEWMNGQWMNE